MWVDGVRQASLRITFTRQDGYARTLKLQFSNGLSPSFENHDIEDAVSPGKV